MGENGAEMIVRGTGAGAAARMMAMAMLPVGRARATEEIAQQQEWANLAALAPSRLGELRAEVDRRWELHRRRALRSTMPMQPKSVIVRSVACDVMEGIV